jgi:hypothetical protein
MGLTGQLSNPPKVLATLLQSLTVQGEKQQRTSPIRSRTTRFK